jgi:nitrite reductase/ring-hydroxylating ferredoxin subunit
MERRSFIAGLLGVSAAVVTNAGTAWGKVKKPANSIAAVSTLKVRQPKLVTASFKGVQRTVVVNRTASSKYIVLDRTCTHQGCAVNLSGVTLQCPCHLAEFSVTTGVNTVAPSGSDPVQPLKTYKTAVKNGFLIFLN